MAAATSKTAMAAARAIITTAPQRIEEILRQHRRGNLPLSGDQIKFVKDYFGFIPFAEQSKYVRDYPEELIDILSMSTENAVGYIGDPTRTPTVITDYNEIILFGMINTICQLCISFTGYLRSIRLGYHVEQFYYCWNRMSPGQKSWIIRAHKNITIEFLSTLAHLPHLIPMCC